MLEVFSGCTLLNKEFVDPEEALRNKVVGIYFSAGCCPPCRDFTPILCDFYMELVEERDPPAQFEIVFVSSDKSTDDMGDFDSNHKMRREEVNVGFNMWGMPKID
uniref:Nucleoredoxin like 2 n=1 Tax=Neolamprologus brichardi TaxID=32507 RepID=A0A3Q4I2U8_NEOBR